MAAVMNEKHRTPLLIYYEEQQALFCFSFLKYFVRKLLIKESLILPQSGDMDFNSIGLLES